VTTVGAVFVPQLPPERLRSVAVAADESGVSELWLWEDCFLESGIASAAAVLAWTTHLRVGIGLLPVPLRNVALTAMETATLDRLFPHRVEVGVGHGVQGWMKQVGAQVPSPLSLLREHLTALRALLDGDTVTVQGTHVQLEGVQLDWPPIVRPPVLAGGEGPKTLRLTGELADGTVLTGGTSPDGVRRARELIEEGRAANARSGHHPIIVYVLTATGTDSAERLRAAQAKLGLAPSPDTGISGDAAAAAEAVSRWGAAGADRVILQPTADDPDPEAFMRFTAMIGQLVQ
jgi:alkanesulfonate monooxygenase SsuD/methylene tetrahydromethanopterin reductase-like flavin-dependent oxidoreductase (luciferase family)